MKHTIGVIEQGSGRRFRECVGYPVSAPGLALADVPSKTDEGAILVRAKGLDTVTFPDRNQEFQAFVVFRKRASIAFASRNPHRYAA